MMRNRYSHRATYMDAFSTHRCRSGASGLPVPKSGSRGARARILLMELYLSNVSRQSCWPDSGLNVENKCQNTAIKCPPWLSFGNPPFNRKAVVSTTKVAEGIKVQSGKHLLLADSAEDFAKACTLLLNDGGLRGRLSEEGFCLVRDRYRYQWKSIEEIIGDIVLGRNSPGKLDTSSRLNRPG